MTTQDNNPAICAAPWVHLYVQPDGKLWPCCTAGKLQYGDTNTDSILDVWQGPVAQKFRQDLLDGVKQECCEFCYTQEKHAGHSLRMRLNEDYGEYISTDLTPTLDHIKYLDVRSSNICNMACVMCNPHFSSKWYEDSKALFGDTDGAPAKFITVNTDAQQAVLDILNDELDLVYFAGGEPLITPYHYEVLQHLIDSGTAHRVKLRYNTNLSTLKYKNLDIFDLWSHFESVTLQVSIDTIGERAEYIRFGQQWQTIVDNWLAVKQRMPEVQIGPQITITSLSIGYLPELLDFLMDTLQFDMSWISYNLSLGPDRTCAKHLPDSVKQQYRTTLTDFLSASDHQALFAPIINASVDFLSEPGEHQHFLDMVKFLDKLDARRGNSWRALWPEIEQEANNDII